MSQPRIIRTLITATACSGRFAGLAGLACRPGGPCRRRSGRGLVLGAVITGVLAAAGVPGVAQAAAGLDSLSGLTWTQQHPAAHPPARSDASMAYDAATGTMVLFGGAVPSGSHPCLRDTWVWDGTTWAKQAPATRPPARSDASMVYDAATGNVVLFGGSNKLGHPLGDTWVWDGTTWTQQHPAAHPPARFDASMAYDATTGNVVLFGGTARRALFGDTWVWDGSNWIEQSPATSPPAEEEASMVYDAATGNVVLFGGVDPPAGGTWVWDGTTWAKQTPVTSPPIRFGASMAYDAATGNVVLFSGLNDRSAYLRDTWTWDGTTWAKQAPATRPLARVFASMAYDPATRNVVLFGGLDRGPLSDTWVWGPSSVRSK